MESREDRPQEGRSGYPEEHPPGVAGEPQEGPHPLQLQVARPGRPDLVVDPPVPEGEGVVIRHVGTTKHTKHANGRHREE